MILLDTHAWLWWITGDSRISRNAHAAIERATTVAIAPISAWEAATLERLGRVQFVPDLRTWLARALGRPDTMVLPLTPEIGVDAGSLPSSFPGDPADRILYATAVAHGIPFVTADHRIRRHDPARTVW